LKPILDVTRSLNVNHSHLKQTKTKLVAQESWNRKCAR